MSDTSTNGGTQAPQDEQLPPLFYERPAPLSPDVHKGMKIRPEADFTFAQKTNAIPVTVPEFVIAARHFPIIFVGDELVPTVAVGLRPEDNLFVNVKGEWDQGVYIPAYIRRHPFILLGAPGDERLRLGIEETARSTKATGRKLFEGDTETETVKQALAMCEQFHGAFLFTADFSKALADTKLTESRNLEISGPNGEVQNIGTFVAVNEEKFKELPDETFLEWRKKGWLHAIYFHLQSLNNWEFLLARASNRMAVASQIA